MVLHIARSEALFAEARRLIPGGVNSPVRAFRSVGGQPLFINKGAGSRVWDADGNEFIDYVLSWGPLILGHADPEVVAAITRQAALGTSYGAPTELELEMARLVQTAYPSMELVRLVNSGTEATMSALRVARAFTQRRRIVKFIGCYHGHSDALLVKAGSGATDMGVPDSPGVPPDVAAGTLSVPFNDLAALQAVFARQGEEIAAVIVEPVVGNMGFVPPRAGYLEGLRYITQKYGALLIFDEVLCGFRTAFGGAQETFGVVSDLTTLGKVIGGGLPVGAYGGRRDIMEMVAPAGPVYQAGTLSGNPLATTAGIVQLRRLSQPGVYDRLAGKTAALIDGFNANFARLGVPYKAKGIGSLWGFFFTDRDVWNYDDALTANTAKFKAYFLKMLEQGIYMAPSQFEAGFLSTAHSDADIERTIVAHAAAIQVAELAV